MEHKWPFYGYCRVWRLRKAIEHVYFVLKWEHEYKCRYILRNTMWLCGPFHKKKPIPRFTTGYYFIFPYIVAGMVKCIYLDMKRKKMFCLYCLTKHTLRIWQKLSWAKIIIAFFIVNQVEYSMQILCILHLDKNYLTILCRNYIQIIKFVLCHYNSEYLLRYFS